MGLILRTPSAIVKTPPVSAPTLNRLVEPARLFPTVSVPSPVLVTPPEPDQAETTPVALGPRVRTPPASTWMTLPEPVSARVRAVEVAEVPVNRRVPPSRERAVPMPRLLDPLSARVEKANVPPATWTEPVKVLAPTT